MKQIQTTLAVTIIRAGVLLLGISLILFSLKMIFSGEYLGIPIALGGLYLVSTYIVSEFAFQNWRITQGRFKKGDHEGPGPGNCFTSTIVDLQNYRRK